MTEKNNLSKNICGFNINYQRSGVGEKVILIHGITTYSFIWDKIFENICKKFDVIVPDLLGCGSSDKPKGVDYSIKSQSEILIKLLKSLDVTKVHIVAHDIGGGIGQIMTIAHSEMVQSLTLINSIGYDFWPVQPISTMRVPIIRQFAMAMLDIGVLKMVVLRGIYYKEKLSDKILSSFMKPLKTREGRQGFLQLARCLNNKHLMEISKSLKSIKVPVLIIRGEGDVYLPSKISEKLHGDIKKSLYKKIKTGGHFIQIDEPLLISDEIMTFLK